MNRATLTAVTISIAATLAPATAATPPSMDQWRLVDGLTFRGLIDDGFEVKAVLIDDTTFYFDSAKYWIYTLQKGTELLECTERIQYIVGSGTGAGVDILRSDLGCYELVAPFEVEEDMGGAGSPPEPGPPADPPI